MAIITPHKQRLEIIAKVRHLSFEQQKDLLVRLFVCRWKKQPKYKGVPTPILVETTLVDAIQILHAPSPKDEAESDSTLIQQMKNIFGEFNMEI